MGFPTVDFGHGIDGQISHSSDHIDIETPATDKTVRINCITKTVAANICGLQVKPRYGVNMTNNIYGAEFEPGCDGTTLEGASVIGIAIRPRLKGGAITGYVTAIEAKLEYPSSSVSPPAVAGISSVLRCDLESYRTFTLGVFPIHVIDPQYTNWNGFAYLPNDGVIASGTGTITDDDGWIAISLAGSTRYIGLAATVGS